MSAVAVSHGTTDRCLERFAAVAGRPSGVAALSAPGNPARRINQINRLWLIGRLQARIGVWMRRYPWVPCELACAYRMYTW